MEGLQGEVGNEVFKAENIPGPLTYYCTTSYFRISS